MLKNRLAPGIGIAAALALALTACSAPEGSEAELRLGADDVGDYNPLTGHSLDGASPFYEGLLKPGLDSGKGAEPEPELALAAEKPKASDNYQKFTVKLRKDVTFSDGSDLTSADVKATYDAATDKEIGSDIQDNFRTLESVETPDEHTVVFNLSDPTLDFEAQMTVGIMPKASIEEGTPADDWKNNTQPVGTGPYQLDSLKSGTAVIKAREDYWNGEPDLKEITYQAYDDDSALTDALKNGKIDGAHVAPRAARDMAKDDRKLVTARTAEWLGITLPSNNAFAEDPKARLAMNIGVDREKIIDEVLDGYGEVAHTPAGPFNGDAYNKDATFDFDVKKANKILDDAGWKKNSDGVREKDGEKAQFKIYYFAGDTMRADMGAELKEQLADLGIETDVKGADREDIFPQKEDISIVYAGGDRLGDTNHQFRSPLHTKTDESAEFENPADVAVPGVDKLLDQAAVSTDRDKANKMYREVQEKYVDEPSYLMVAFSTHTYIDAASDWKKPGVFLEPHAHGTDWGPWATLEQWTKK